MLSKLKLLGIELGDFDIEAKSLDTPSVLGFFEIKLQKEKKNSLDLSRNSIMNSSASRLLSGDTCCGGAITAIQANSRSFILNFIFSPI